jgi:hypothetical protein
MKVLEFYDGTKTYMYPNMKLATPDVMQADYPAILTFRHVIETDEAGQVCFAIENFAAMKSRFNIDSSLSDNEALAEIQEIINTPAPEGLPSPEERIASAIEFQTMMMLPDEEV